MEDENRIAVELMFIISKYPYKCYFSYISLRDSVTEDSFALRAISCTHWIDCRSSYTTNNLRNSNFIFEVFGAFSGENTSAVRADIINHIKLEDKLYASVGQIILNMRSCDLPAWLEDMADLNQFPDELMIYALSRTYNRHTMIILKDQNWSTVSSDNPISDDKLWSICHVHLAYLGNGVFAEVKIKPFEGPHKDPITMEALARALNKIRGKGRPQSQPLNLVIKPSMVSCSASTSNYTDLVDSAQDQNNSTIDDTITPIPEDLENVTSTGTDGASTNQGENPTIKPATIAALSESGIKGNNIVSSDQGVNPSANTSDSTQNRPVVDNNSSSKGGNKTPGTGNVSTGHNDDTGTGRTTGENEVSTSPKASISSNNVDTEDNEDLINANSDVSTNVQQKIYALWENEAKKGNSCVPLVKMMESDIKQFQPKEPSIDPYSSLEDVGNTSADEEDVSGEAQPQPQAEKQYSDTDAVETTQYYVRERKTLRQRMSSKPLRENHTPVNYADMISSDQDSSSPKRPKKHPHVSSAPSSSRIAAQDEIRHRDLPKGKPSTPVVPAHRFTMKDPSRSTPVHRRKPKVEPPSNPDPDTFTLVPDEQDEHEANPQDSVTPKGSFAMENHGLKKYKPDRWFKCPVCGIHKGTMHRLNDHYKRRHKPLQCEKCEMVFNTPSGLSRHRYTHAEKGKRCTDCGKCFHFESELAQHRIMHRKVPGFKCNYGNCEWCFMNNPDLFKHIRTHKASLMHCEHCEYSTKDKCLLSNHLKMHSDDLPFKCDICGTRFRHRNQLRHHKNDPKKCNNRSKSPEF